MNYRMKRRSFLGASFVAGLSVAGLGSCSSQSRSSNSSGTQTQTKSLIASTFPGNWEDAHRNVLVPAFKSASGAEVTLVPLVAFDQIARLIASPNNPPFDVALLDPGAMATLPKDQVLQKFPADLIENYKHLLPVHQNAKDGWGPTVALQMVGLAYNKKTVTTPPTSWAELSKPEYKGRIGIVAMSSTLGTAWMVEMAKLNGGSESNLEPAFKLIKDLMPNVGAVANNPAALATLFQQGEIDIAPHYLNAMLSLRDKGVEVDWAMPEEGGVAVTASMHVVKNPQAGMELAASYINTALSMEVQKAMAEAPYYLAPTRKDVTLPEAVAKRVAGKFEDFSKLSYLDWNTISQYRPEWIDRFNKEVKV